MNEKRPHPVNEMGYACSRIPQKDWDAMSKNEQYIYCIGSK
ncbi:hypothetical protein ES708_02622 [subsurface metagenome]